MGFSIYGIPTSATLEERFSFFKDLLESRGSLGNARAMAMRRIAEHAKKQLYKNAKDLYNSKIQAIGGMNATALEEACSFLETVISNEQAKEVAAVKAYIKKLSLVIDQNKLDTLTPEAFQQNPSQFYINLTQLLNECKTTATDFKTLIEKIYDRSKRGTNRKRDMSDYMEDDVNFRMRTDLGSFLKKMSTTFRGKDDYTDRYNHHLQLAAIEIVNKIVPQGIRDGADYAALALMVEGDLNRHMQQVINDPHNGINMLGNKSGGASQELLDELNAITEKYLTALDKPDSTDSVVQKMLQDINSSESQRLLQQTKDFFDIRLGTSALETSRLNDLSTANKSRSKANNNARKVMQEIRSKIPKNFISDLNKLQFTTSLTSTSKRSMYHGNVREWIVGALENGSLLTGKASRAVDEISFLIADNGLPQQATMTLQRVLSLAQSAYQAASSPSEHEGRFDSTPREEIEQLDQQLQAAVAEAEKILNQLGLLNNEDFFIFHDSIKLSSAVETGKTSFFKGRTMKLLSFFDYLGTLASTSGGLTEADLGFIAANISPSALGEDVGPIENYLALFASIIMFDDIKAIAQEAAAQLNARTSSIHQIHVYNLNGVYVPGSMIMYYTLQQVRNFQNSGTYGTEVEIDSSKATESIDAWVAEYGTPGIGLPPDELQEHWGPEADKASNGIDVKIVFMRAFLDFIESLGQ